MMRVMPWQGATSVELAFMVFPKAPCVTRRNEVVRPNDARQAYPAICVRRGGPRERLRPWRMIDGSRVRREKNEESPPKRRPGRNGTSGRKSRCEAFVGIP